ncbi:MAG TPA: hypothetical protein VEX37_00605 [Thermomicrobiales bacterium]|nr:hypothetical protein [Thermomicrobiales bacterium]
MPVDHVLNNPWTRKHDDPRFDLIPQAPKIAYPKSLLDLIELCRDRPSGEHVTAAGSHWGLSQAAISDHTFIETHDYRNQRQVMGRTLHEVAPHCLHPELLERMSDDAYPSRYGSLVHIESGKRVYQLYAELDQPDPLNTNPPGGVLTLGGYMKERYGKDHYAGPWAFETLGNAGGQTVVGAFSTGTHGGDFDRPPIADSVVAIHLVADGGKHYWIETYDRDRYYPQLTDDDALHALYGTQALGGPDNFEIIREQGNQVFDAVLVSAGRFGVIYSVVLRAIPQYALYERRRLHVWQDIKHQIKNLGSPLYTDAAILANGYVPSTPPAPSQRFLQVAVCLTPHANFKRNLAGVTKQWQIGLQPVPPGRGERVGAIEDDFDARLQAPRFSLAGKNYSYRHDPDNPLSAEDDPDPIALACSNGSFLAGVIDAAIKQIEKFIETNGAVVGAGIAGVVALGGGGLLLLIPALLLILAILRELLDAFDADDRFGEHVERIKNELLDPNEPDPLKRAAGLFAWQLIMYLGFQSQQSERDYEAISYAVTDQKDYRNISCEVNVDSVEVFFDAVDDRLITFVDALLAYEVMQEFQGKAFVGYASLRFMGQTRALLGMQQHPVTCAVEVACLKDVSGSQELIDYAVRLALNPNIGGVLHWGQRNDATEGDIQRLFGDNASPTNGKLGAWREALARITDGGSLDGFSNEFTRRTGLEV